MGFLTHWVIKENKEETKMIDFLGFLIAFWLLGWIIVKWVNS